MNLVYIAVVLALIAAGVDWFTGGIKEPWRKVIFAGCVILFIVGLLLTFVPLPWRM